MMIEILSLPDEATRQRNYLSYDLEVLRSMQTNLGCVIASPTDDYSYIWTRDVGYLVLYLLDAKEFDLAGQMLRGLIDIHHQHRYKISYRLRDGRPSIDEECQHFHPRHTIVGNEINHYWHWRQNDGIGLLLLAQARMEKSSSGYLRSEDFELIQEMVLYLNAIECWDRDYSTWEWPYYERHYPSIAACIAGLDSVSEYVDVPSFLIESCYASLQGLGNRHSPAQPIDLAHLLVKYPIGINADIPIDQIEEVLLKSHGVVRFPWDLYENGYDQRWAEWVMGVYMLGQYWAKEDRAKARYYLDFGDSLRLPISYRPDDLRHEFPQIDNLIRLGQNLELPNGLLPETYRQVQDHEDKIIYVPCRHTPLAWAHGCSIALRSMLDL